MIMGPPQQGQGCLRVAAGANVRARRGKEAFRVGNALVRVHAGIGFGGVVRRQIFDLLDVKDRVSLHERDVVRGLFAGLLVDLSSGDEFTGSFGQTQWGASGFVDSPASYFLVACSASKSAGETYPSDE